MTFHEVFHEQKARVKNFTSLALITYWLVGVGRVT